jgi:hypothetical protein
MMQETSRKASDVLLDLESKVNELLEIVKNQNFNMMILSNKLNEVMQQMSKKITVEAVQNFPLPSTKIAPQVSALLPPPDPERNIPFIAEDRLPQEENLQGFRRTSRPETYANATFQEEKADPMQPQTSRITQNKPTMQPPPGRSMGLDPSIMSGKVPLPDISNPPAFPMTDPQLMPSMAQGQVPVVQRCVDKNGKAIFLASVKIIDSATNQVVHIGKTNALGKFQAPLSAGKYRVEIQKREHLGSGNLQAIEDIEVNGQQSKLELPNLIVK